jgi:hypothetical protein
LFAETFSPGNLAGKVIADMKNHWGTWSHGEKAVKTGNSIGLCRRNV